MSDYMWNVGIRYPASGRHLQWFSVENLRYHTQQELPLLVTVSSTMERNFVVYNCNLSSVTSAKSWTVSYWYSEFVDFKSKLDGQWTCQDANCSGSCQGLRDIVSAFFPKKRLPSMSKNQRATTSRTRKFEFVLIHLLRSILLPGSTMKCLFARQKLPPDVFAFLGVEDAADRRTLLQIFVDNCQVVTATTNQQSPSDTTQCPICLNTVIGTNQQRDLENSETDSSDEEDAEIVDGDNDADDKLVKLPCEHVFHRQCVFQWLLFEFHCPVCRTGLCANAWMSKCRAQKHEQWWLSDFDKDLLHGG